MEFRRARHYDKSQIFDICKNIWEGHDYIPNVFDEWVADEAGEFTVIEEAGQITGLGKLTLVEPGIGWLEGLRVAPNARSKGYGKKITGYYIQKGLERGFRQLRLSTYYQNHASIRVIESFGFNSVAEFYLSEIEVDPTHETTAEVLQATPDSADTARVIEQMLEAPEQKVVKDYLGYGWLFKKLTQELLLEEVTQGHIYYLKQDGEIVSSMLIYPDQVKDRGFYYIVMVTGTDQGIGQLLDWTHQDAGQRGMTMLGAMIPNERRVKELFLQRGFKHWDQDEDIEANVFVYEYDLEEGE